MNLSPRTRTLVALLASENDGECLNAARALGRALKADNMDFHDLASQRLVAPRPTPCPHCAVRSRQKRDESEPQPHAKDLAWMLGQQFRFSEKERDFLATVAGWKGELTEKQDAWFQTILAKVKAYAEMSF